MPDPGASLVEQYSSYTYPYSIHERIADIKAEIEKRTSTEENIKPSINKVKYPDWLDDSAKKEWRRIITELKKLKLVTNIDVAALAICCDAYSKYVKATGDINKVGLLISYTNSDQNNIRQL